ncbi:MmgE/PrpD family protein [Aeromicrobium sp. UC242_57]|uniref:MmgE/PrpD family protein n=1 Tax=Aeromicrobium sp. UC242_57 TaxID=3374624 RepID=UPI003788F6E2
MSTDRVMQFATGLTHQDIPEPARTRAHQALRDTVAVAFGGQRTLAARTGMAAMAGEQGRYVALGSREPGSSPVSATAAAFVSGMRASALDYDDGHYRGGAIHPSSVIVPTVLLAASDSPVPIEDVVTAQVAGYEVAVRLAHLLLPETLAGQWHCTGTAATVGAAVAAAKVRGGDADTVRRAAVIAWAHAPMAALQLPMVKEAIGWSAATGLNAALMAERGLMRLPSGVPVPKMPGIFPATPFDAPGADVPFVLSLGREFEIEQSYLKPYPACRYTHTAADVLLEQLGAGLEAADVASVRVATHAQATFLDYQRPPTLEHAQYSLPWVVAAALADGEVTPAQMCDERLADPALLDIAARVTVVHAPELDAFLPDHYATQLQLTLRDGRVLELEPRLAARGDVSSPLTEQDLAAKVESLVGPASTDLVAALSPGGDTESFWAALPSG